MSVERLLQINVATVAALGTLLLGMGQQSVFLPLVATLAAVTSVTFTDTLGWFRLNPHMASLAAAAAVALAFYEVRQPDTEVYLLAIANLLIYLQIVLLHQEKNFRIYWHLIVLSLLQVVVAAALSLGFEFGLLLVVYMLLTLSGLVLLFVHRETARFASDGVAISSVGAFSMTPATEPSRRRFELVPSRSGRRGAAESARLIFSLSAALQIGVMAMTTLVATSALFFSVPRVGKRTWQGRQIQQRLVGFSQDVHLGEMSELLESDEPAMTVRLRDQFDVPVKPAGELYFRGSVLSRYTVTNKYGRWTRHPAAFYGRRLPGRTRSASRVRQLISQQPVQQRRQGSRNRILFGIAPAFSTSTSAKPDDVRYDPFTSEVWMRKVDHQDFRQEIWYELYTDMPPGGRPSRLRQHYDGKLKVQLEDLTEDGDPRDDRAKMLSRLKKEPKPRFPVLTATAQKVLAEVNLPSDDRIGMALALERHFLEPGLYTYSLDADFERASDQDPVEDFVANHRTGHCEYFASALVLMLRSQGLPARMVIGYKGGEYNSVGGYYQVRQKHAHAWAEVFLRPGDDPRGKLAAEEIGEHGAWLRLDPTPIDDRADAPTAETSFLDKLVELKDYTQLLWNDYVLGYDAERQWTLVYGPVSAWSSGTIRGLFSPDAWRRSFQRIARWEGWDPDHWLSGKWINWRAGVFASALTLVLVGLYRTLRRPVRTVLEFVRRRRREAPARRLSRVAFYRRLEAILARRGMTRRRNQTQSEFATEVAGRLVRSPASRRAADLPQRIVEAFYLVRFGRATLDNQQVQAVEQALADLEAALAAQ